MKHLLFLFLLFTACNSAPTTQTKFSATLAAGTPLSFTQITADFNRPGAGANQWSYGQNVISIPTQGVNTQRLDAYWRFMWTDFQPFNGSAGSYDWSAFDKQINDAISKGQKFSFGYMQQCGGCDGNLKNSTGGASLIYPLWLHNQMQTDGKDYNDGGNWVANPGSKSYIAAVTALNNAINSHILSGSYKGVAYKNVISQIDIRGYGDYGEWTNNPTAIRPSAAALKSLVDAYVKTFTSFHLVAMQATFDGNQLQNTMIPPEVGAYMLSVSNDAGKVGIRNDSWGQTDSYESMWKDKNPTVYSGMRFDTAIMNRWKVAPIVGEPQDGSTAGTFGDLVRQVQFYHATSFGNGNFNIASNASNATVQANFRAASKVAGYRLTITGGNLSASSITLNWSNTGVAPVYEDWDAMIELRSGSKVIWTVKSKFVPRLFLPGAATVTDVLPTGSGDLYLIIRDPNSYRKPMPLAITGQNADGSYLIQADVTIESVVIPPPVIVPGKCDTIISRSIRSVDYFTVSDSTRVITPRTVYDTTWTHSSHQDSLVSTRVVKDTVKRDCPPVVVTPPPVITPPVKVISIFTTQIPAAAVDNDNKGGDEKGIKFTSSVSGSITGVRFYKKAGMNGPHTGELYFSSGVRMASATFTKESASGWQTVLFSKPVAITAGTTYTAAVFFADGNYIEDNDYFTKSVTNGVLTAAADGTKGAQNAKDNGTGQGVYIYTKAPAFPNVLYKSANYWIDVVFQP